MKNFIVYFKTADIKFRTFNYKTKVFETINRLPLDISNFEFRKVKNMKFEGNDEGLKLYAELLYKSSKSLAIKTQKLLNTSFKYIGDKTKTRIHAKSIEAFFNMCCYDTVTKTYNYEIFKDLSYDEIELMNMTYNGYLRYLEKGIFNIIEYDVKGFYQHILNDKNFMLCHSQGCYKNLKKLPEKLYIGYYFVKITCDDEFKKMFMLNPKNVYTNYDLMTVRKYQKEFNIKVEFTKETNNAYVYEMKKHCIKSSKIFGKWSLIMDVLKSAEELKDNILIKPLSSQLAGNLRRKNNARTLTEEEVDKLNDENLISFDDTKKYKIIDIVKTEEGEKYIVQDTENQYYYRFRLNSFIVSYGRMIMADIAYKIGLKNIKRICCDGICTVKEFDIFTFNKNNYYQLVLDKQGTYEIKNINEKITKIN
jgi:hypothetical protein